MPVCRIAKNRYLVMSVRPSARVEQLSFHWTDFHEIWRVYLSKSCQENLHFIKILKESRVPYITPNVHLQ
jgi:hypothetical protein